MAATTTFSIFIPLVALIVVELSGVSRDIELTEKRNALSVGVFPVDWPSLGRLAMVHIANTMLLAFGVTSTMTFLPPAVSFFATAPLLIIWVIMPMLEVGSYEEILKQEIRPASFQFHFVATATIVVAYTSGVLPIPLMPLTQLFSAASASVAILYLYLLEGEVESLD